jgi:hypothetical protein
MKQQSPQRVTARALDQEVPDALAQYSFLGSCMLRTRLK